MLRCKQPVCCISELRFLHGLEKMNILNMLSKAKISLHIPKWLISFSMFFQAGVRGVSLGARVVILDAKGAVFLVRHSYVKGWFLPGGGVDRGEIPIMAAKREMREEARMIATAEPELLGVYLYDGYHVPDYICCYIVRDWVWDSPDGNQPEGPSADGEIVESAFFPLDALPDGITPATRARLEEVTGKRRSDGLWRPVSGNG